MGYLISDAMAYLRGAPPWFTWALISMAVVAGLFVLDFAVTLTRRLALGR